jgi:hypothetical protein
VVFFVETLILSKATTGKTPYFAKITDQHAVFFVKNTDQNARNPIKHEEHLKIGF